MLPIIAEEVRQAVFAEIIKDMPIWRKGMIHYIKEENPEINAAIIDMAQQTDLDPKAVALGAYMVYKMLEDTEKLENGALQQILE
ncbi:MAG: hypothetical protein WCK67_12730 [bacterium]